MPELFVRPEPHEIDTAARRRVPVALPDEWEHREKTGRDYGVDMEVELFVSGHALGTFLLFQIKGTGAQIEGDVASLAFDIGVRSMRYAELFVAPIVLTICPVEADPPQFYFLWLQEYVRVVLDIENPDWRSNERTVRVRVPVENKMPGNRDRLSFIAGYPRRLSSWGQVGRIQHELRWAADWAALAPDETDAEEVRRYRALLDDAAGLPGLFDDPSWDWGRSGLQQVIEPGRRACELLLRGGPFTVSDVESLGPVLVVTDDVPDGYPWFAIKNQLIQTAQQLSAALATGNDYALKRTNWEHYGGHDF